MGGPFPTDSAFPELSPKRTNENIMSKEEKAPEESAAKKAFRALIEVYKKQSPRKYELKKAELEKKLAAIA